MKKIFLINILILLSFSISIMKLNAQDITSDLVAYYQFEETSTTTGDPIYDSAGNHHGIIGSGITGGISGVNGNAFNFSGAGVVTITNESDITDYTEFTLSAWVNPSSLGSSNGIISRVTPGRDFFLSLNNSKIKAQFYDGGYKNCYSTTIEQTGQWIHVLCIWENNQWKVYRNGVLESTCDFTGYDPPWTANNLYLGGLTTSGEKFIGKIDEVRIYNRALSQADINTLYNTTGGNPTPMLSVNHITANEDDENAIFTIELTQTISEEVTCQYTTNNVNAIAGEDYSSTSGSITIPANNQSISVNVPILDDSTSEPNEGFSLTISNLSSNVNIGQATGICTIIDDDNDPSESLIAHYKLEDASGIVTDETGNSNGTNYGATGTEGKVGNAFYFDGTNDYVAIDKFYDSDNIGAFSVVAWVKVPSDGGDWSIMDFDRSDYFTCTVGIPNNSYSGTGNYIGFHTSYNSSTSDFYSNYSGIRDDNWHQVAWVFNGSTKYIYVDGLLDATQNVSGVGSTNVRYGFLGDGSEATVLNGDRNDKYYKGSMDEVRLYNIALTQNDITTLYTIESSDDYWVQNGTNVFSTNSGNVGIGTTSPDEKLTVDGIIQSKEVIVTSEIPAPDYVFNEDYELLSISELKEFLEKNSHLPEFPSAKEMAKDGINLSQINMNLLKRIEELTLYLIEQEKKIQKIENQYNLNKK